MATAKLLINFAFSLMLSLSSAITLRNPFSFKGNSQNDERKLVPKLLPHHEDECYIVEFHSDTSENTEMMEPVLKRLEEDIDTKVRRINISRRKDLYSILESMGHDECGTLPFYYNRRTGQAICGATTYQNLKNLATGRISSFIQSPESLRMKEMEAGPRRDIGVKGYFDDKIRGLEKKGRARAQKQTKAVAERQGGKKSKSTAEPEAPSSAAERIAARRAAREAKKVSKQ